MSALARSPQQAPEQAPAQEQTQAPQNARPKAATGGSPPPSDADQASEQKKLAQQLGMVTSMGDFSKKAGGLIESVAKKPGSQGGVKLSVNFPVGAGTLSVGFSFDGQVSRSQENKLTAGFEVGVTGTAKVDAWIAEVFAQARVFGYLEATGDTGQECLELVGLAIEQRIRSITGGGKVADVMFGKDYAKGVAKNMDKNDSVESGLGASMEVGARLDSSKSAGGSASGQTGTKLTAKDGKLNAQDAQRYKRAVTVQADPFALNGSFVESYIDGKLDSTEFAVSGSRQMAISETIENVQNNKVFQKVLGKVQKMLGTLATRAGSAGIIGKLAALAAAAQSSGPALDEKTKAAIEKIKGLEKAVPYKAGWQISVSVKWADNQPSLSLRLEKVSNVTWGQDRSDPVYLAIENLQSVFELKLP